MNVKSVIHHNVQCNSTELEKFCRENGIKKLSLFGSVLRDDFRTESDIDILVEFLPDEVVTFIRMSQLERMLSGIFGGRKVDLRTPGELSKNFRDKIFIEAEILYVY